MKKIEDKRIDAVYEFVNNADGRKRKKLLTLVLAMLPKRYFKDIVEQFDIKIK